MEELLSTLVAQRNDFLIWYNNVSILTQAYKQYAYLTILLMIARPPCLQNEDELVGMSKAVDDWKDAALEAQKEVRKTEKTLQDFKHLLVMSESTSRQRKIIMDTAIMERDAMARKLEIWKTRGIKFARLMGRMYLNGDLGPYLSPIE